jgi:hypothetical protein
MRQRFYDRTLEAVLMGFLFAVAVVTFWDPSKDWENAE